MNERRPALLAERTGHAQRAYSVELNDLGLFTMRGLTGPQFLQTVKDQLDQLYADSASSGRSWR
jgi:hypothetical protein